MTDAQDVIDYLEKNPNFFIKNPDILDVIKTPKDQTKGRKIADFQHYVAERAKGEKQKSEKEAAEIIETARFNMDNQTRIYGASLKLLEAETFDDFIQTITMDLTAMLQIDIVSMIVETNASLKQTQGIPIVPEGTIGAWMGDKTSMLEDNIKGLEDIYGGGAGLVNSQALMRIDISKNTPPAIIAFGSRNPDLFTPHQGVEQVSYLVRVIERMFRHWLALPQMT